MKDKQIHCLIAVACVVAGCSSEAPTDHVEVGVSESIRSKATSEIIDLNGMEVELRPPGIGGSRFSIDGVRLKVVAIHETGMLKSLGGVRNGKFVRMFDLLYVHDIRETGQRAWMKVSYSPDPGSDLGWISSDDVHVWGHRVGYRPILLEEFPLVRLPIYESADDAERALEGAAGVEPVAFIDLIDLPATGPLPIHPWPILEKRSVKCDGVDVQALRVAMLGKSANIHRAEVVEAYTAEETREMAAQLRSLDLAVAIDNTGSMRRWMKSTRKAVADFSQSLATMECEPSLLVSLTTYRDAEDGDDMCRHYALEDVGTFCERLDNVVADGGGDTPEAGFEALMFCLEKTTFRPRSQRVLLLCGDAPFHVMKSESNPRGLTPEDIAAVAKQHHVHIFALSVGSNCSNRDEQFRAIAASTGGKLLPIDSIAELEEEIAALLARESQTIATTVDVFEGIVRGQSNEEIAATVGRSPEQVTHIVDVLRAVKGIDPQRLAAGETVAITGWITPFIDEVRVGQLEVLSFRTESEEVLKILQKMLRVTPGVEFGVGLFDSAQEHRLRNETIGEYMVTECLPFRGSSILSYSLHDLRRLSERQRHRLQDEVYVFIGRLDAALKDNRRWSRLPEDGRVLGWVPEDCLP